MSTLTQLKTKYCLKKKKHCWARRLKQNPQKRGTILRVTIITPRKPNSARRPIAKVYLSSKLRLAGHIPGIGHNLRRYSTVLVRGGGARDVPGSYYSCVRGVLDFLGVIDKVYRRSIYGVKKPAFLRTHVRRKIRKYFT